MRVVKTAEERRNEILDAAEHLFAQKGFDGTSTNDILNQVGIARGTLYYHFKSKEDIMDALIERYTEQLLGAAQVVAADKSIPVMERIIHTVMALNLNNHSESGGEIIEHIHKPQNARMQQKIQFVIINRLPGILTDIIEEGIREGLFETPFPYECMEMVVAYINHVFDGEMIEMTEEGRNKRIQAFIFNIERLLGTQPGAVMDIIQIFDRGDRK